MSSRLVSLENHHETRFGQRPADQVADVGGCWSFIIFFLGFITVWITLDFLAIEFGNWDPYPYILFNLVLFCAAALQAPNLMTSQNRQKEKDRGRARGDF